MVSNIPMNPPSLPYLPAPPNPGVTIPPGFIPNINVPPPETHVIQHLSSISSSTAQAFIEKAQELTNLALNLFQNLSLQNIFGQSPDPDSIYAAFQAYMNHFCAERLKQLLSLFSSTFLVFEQIMAGISGAVAFASIINNSIQLKKTLNFTQSPFLLLSQMPYQTTLFEKAFSQEDWKNWIEKNKAVLEKKSFHPPRSKETVNLYEHLLTLNENKQLNKRFTSIYSKLLDSKNNRTNAAQIKSNVIDTQNQQNILIALFQEFCQEHGLNVNKISKPSNLSNTDPKAQANLKFLQTLLKGDSFPSIAQQLEAINIRPEVQSSLLTKDPSIKIKFDYTSLSKKITTLSSSLTLQAKKKKLFTILSLISLSILLTGSILTLIYLSSPAAASLLKPSLVLYFGGGTLTLAVKFTSNGYLKSEGKKFKLYHAMPDLIQRSIDKIDQYMQKHKKDLPAKQNLIF